MSEQQEREQEMKLIVTERGPGEPWLLNLGKFNDETDVEISPEIGRSILRLQATREHFLGLSDTSIEVDWCLTHSSRQAEPGMCENQLIENRWDSFHAEECVIVPRLLVDAAIFGEET